MGNELEDELKGLEITALNEKAENAVAVAVAATAATGAADTPNASSRAFTRSATSRIVSVLISSRIAVLHQRQNMLLIQTANLLKSLLTKVRLLQQFASRQLPTHSSASSTISRLLQAGLFKVYLL